jgi:NAD+ diphosphatase
MVQWNYCPVCGIKMIKDGESRPTCPDGHFTKYPTPVAATFAFIRNNDEYLILKRARDPQKGAWDLPGGFLEYGENAIECLRREIEEETALKNVKEIEHIGTYPTPYGDIDKVLSLAYVFESDDRNVTLSEENTEYRWVSIADMPDLALDDTQSAMEFLRKRDGIIS